LPSQKHICNGCQCIRGWDVRGKRPAIVDKGRDRHHCVNSRINEQKRELVLYFFLSLNPSKIRPTPTGAAFLGSQQPRRHISLVPTDLELVCRVGWDDRFCSRYSATFTIKAHPRGLESDMEVIRLSENHRCSSQTSARVSQLQMMLQNHITTQGRISQK
jgi:hypothetical protein